MIKFPAMLGPAEDWPEGSLEWSERMSHRLQIAVNEAEMYGIDRVVEQLEKILPNKPWEQFPPPKDVCCL